MERLIPWNPNLLAVENNNRDLITFCGLCCSDCHGYSGVIAAQARDLRRELRRAKYAKFAAAIAHTPFGKAFTHYDSCYELLGAMMKFRCRKGCRNGGGPPFCKIRECCREKTIAGCWECDDTEICKKLDFLNAVHGDAHRRNIRAIRKKGISGFMTGKRSW